MRHLERLDFHPKVTESFLALVKNRFGKNGMYVLDEPEAALSPQRQLGLLSLLDELAQRGGSQCIIATHSPIILAYPDAMIYSLDGKDGARVVDYESTEHYALTRDFLLNRERYLNRLLNPSREASDQGAPRTPD